jgi:FKBP-type peptidyl-prolyl cis-trans isomerase
MGKPFTTLAITLIAGIISFGALFAQQTSVTNTQHAPASSTKKTTAAKRATAPISKPKPLTLTTQQDKISYALGMNMAKNLQRQSVEVNPEVMSRGLKDVLAGNKTLLTEDEAKATLTALQNDMRATQQKKAEQLGQTNKKEGEDFLAANKGKEGVVTLPSGLQYKILKEGTGPKPSASDSVVCNYRGTLINGTEFDSSYKRGQPATFPVTGVIKGWTEALQLMPVGSKWQLFIPPGLAYGDRGAGPDIGPDTTLVFEVELLSIQGK